MANFNRIAQLHFLVEKITEIKKRNAEMKIYRSQIINDIHERTKIDIATIIGFIDQDPYNSKLLAYQNNIMTSVLVARNAIPNPKKPSAPINNNKESLNNTNPPMSASKTPTTNYSVTPNSTKSLSSKTNLEEKSSLITSTPSNVCPSSNNKRSRSRSKSNPNINANGLNDNPEISMHSALNLLKEDNDITNIIKKEKNSPTKNAKKSKFDPTSESNEYIEVPDNQSDDAISNEELDMISQLPGLEGNHVKTDQRNNNVDDHEN